MAKAQIKKAQIYEEYKKRKDGKELKINKKQKIGIIGLAVMIAAFVAFRVFYQKGAKLLADMYPWNYVALVIIVGLLIWYFLWAKKHGDDDKKVESDADLTQKKPLLTSNQIGLAAAFGSGRSVPRRAGGLQAAHDGGKTAFHRTFHPAVEVIVAVIQEQPLGNRQHQHGDEQAAAYPAADDTARLHEGGLLSGGIFWGAEVSGRDKGKVRRGEGTPPYGANAKGM